MPSWLPRLLRRRWQLRPRRHRRGAKLHGEKSQGILLRMEKQHIHISPKKRKLILKL